MQVDGFKHLIIQDKVFIMLETANGNYLPDGGTALRGNYVGIGYEYNTGI